MKGPQAFSAMPEESTSVVDGRLPGNREPGDVGPAPRVSVGLPVYNGERFVGETIESILAQTYEDFELIICDNASTDRTEAVCRGYAAADRRVHYLRNATNLGAAKNYNLTVNLASGEYFKWAAADDLIAPQYLEECVKVLDANPDVVLCHTKTRFVDEEGRHLAEHEDLMDFRARSASKRYAAYLFRRAGGWSAILGLMRLAELRQTPLHGTYIEADKVLLGELILRGQVHQVPQRLLSRRRHAQQSWQANRTREALLEWFDPLNRGKWIPPRHLKLFIESLKSIRRTPLLRGSAMRCYHYAFVWGARAMVARPLKRKVVGLMKYIGMSGRAEKRGRIADRND